MRAYKRSTIMLAHRVRSLRGSKLSQAAIANKLGISQSAVGRILSGSTQLLAQYKIADRMAHFGLLGRDGNKRALAYVDVTGYTPRTDNYAHRNLHSRELAFNDPLAILMAHERFGTQATVLDELPERIDLPQPQEFTVHTDTWAEFVQRFKGNERAAIASQRDGGSVLAREGSEVSSYAVRDVRYDYGYPFRDTVVEREYVATQSILRRRARARLGREFLLSLDSTRYLSAEYEKHSTEERTVQTSHEVSNVQRTALLNRST